MQLVIIGAVLMSMGVTWIVIACVVKLIEVLDRERKKQQDLERYYL